MHIDFVGYRVGERSRGMGARFSVTDRRVSGQDAHLERVADDWVRQASRRRVIDRRQVLRFDGVVRHPVTVR
jgi:hypothetical protein